MNEELLATVRDKRMGFATGVAVLAVLVPPNWSTWLAGDLSEWQVTIWIAAAAAVVRGLLWLIGQATGICMDRLTKRKETDA